MADVTIADLANTGTAARTDQVETDDGVNSRRRTVANLLGLAQIGDVSGLQTALDAKANLSHTHDASNINTGTLALARGGTGAGDAANARINIGLGPADSPQFTAINIGDASDTTLARSSPGNLSVEGNLLYRAGGTDVPLADGGTGASLSAPVADRIMFYDFSGGAVTWLELGSGLGITGTTLNVNPTSGDVWEINTASNPSSPHTLATVTGNAVTQITGLTGNLTINKPAGTATSGERTFRIVEITASGGDRTITWGTGISLGIGVAPSLVVPSGSTVRFVLYTDDAWATALYDGDFATATETSRGLVELATSAEINTGTDASRAISPDQLAASYAGTKAVSLPLTALQTDDLAIGDGQAVLVIPASAHGMNLVGQVVTVATAGTTGTTDIQLRRVRAGSAVDMLSTKLTIDSAETSSITAATPAVIDASNDDVQTGDLIFVDIDATATTKPKGGAVALEFRLP